jgi:hypothetical protein
MSPRLLRPLAPSGDSDVRAYVAAVEQADTQSLEQGIKDAYRDFIVGCKSDGIWDSIKASCILAGARTLAGALVPLKGTAPTNVNNNFVSGDYNRKTGLTSDGTTKGIDTGLGITAMAQDSVHMSVFINAWSELQARNAIAATSGAGGAFISIDGLAPAVNTRLNSSSNATSAAPVAGLIGMSRSAGAAYTVRTGGSDETVSVASVSPSAANINVFQRSDGAGKLTGTIAFYSAGDALSLSLLDARLSALMTAIGAAIP